MLYLLTQPMGAIKQETSRTPVHKRNCACVLRSSLYHSFFLLSSGLIRNVTKIFYGCCPPHKAVAAGAMLRPTYTCATAEEMSGASFGILTINWCIFVFISVLFYNKCFAAQLSKTSSRRVIPQQRCTNIFIYLFEACIRSCYK